MEEREDLGRPVGKPGPKKSGLISKFDPVSSKALKKNNERWAERAGGKITRENEPDEMWVSDWELRPVSEKIKVHLLLLDLQRKTGY
eukprot:CAMPEP_0169167682 /NCGR_PEP_ID=MMETSP1015-20121227/60604_1 /TAXON_ID=342587 /ORGANISM="Karlodinium micrum, Strain CCMP2283" /LENGTH=86 /DNA_ID=CAMNT_0009240413 /DNA_START=251 /DNA_END=511 /DNA_ORIENTATION=-